MPTVPRGFGGIAGAKYAVVVRGVPKLNKKLDAYGKLTAVKTYDALKRAALMLEAKAKQLVTSGYYKPAIDTGRMRGSITNSVVKFSKKDAEVRVGTNVYYAIYVHEGTIRMKPRPFLVDALKQLEKIIAKMIEKALQIDFGVI